jgi:hypothetical protein
MLSCHIGLRDQDLPTVVTESGWAEFMPRMQDEIKTVLTGLNYAVKIYIIAKWTKLPGAVFQLRLSYTSTAVEVFLS